MMTSKLLMYLGHVGPVRIVISNS